MMMMMLESISGLLFVLVPPEWIVKPHDMEAIEGQDVFFPCRVSGVPEPTIAWRKLAGNLIIKYGNTERGRCTFGASYKILMIRSTYHVH
jgi:hypothetical protein